MWASPRTWAMGLCILCFHSMSVSAAQTPNYDTVIESARAGHAAESLVQLQALYVKYPHNKRLVFDYIAVSSWAGDDARATTLYDLLSPGQKPAYVLKAAAKSYRNLRNYPRALTLYQEGMQDYPTDTSFAAGEILVLADEGQYDQALALAQNTPPALSPAEMHQIEGQEAAALVREGEAAPDLPPQRFAITDRSIERLNTLIASWQNQPNAANDILHARFDRMVALRDRVRMRDVINEYQSLKNSQVPIPPYALQAAADAYLYEHDPKTAAALYQQVITAEPQNTEAQIGLFYTYIETENFKNAYALIDRLNAQQPTLPAAERVRTEILAARARQYADNLAAAQKRVETVAAAVPAQANVQASLGDIYSAQGWPRRASMEYAAAAQTDPNNLGVKTGTANDNLQLRNYPLAEQQTQYLHTFYPENRSVQRLQQSWDIYNRPELQVSVGQAWRSDNANTVVGTNGLTVGSRLYSSPIDYYYRPYVGLDYSSDKLQTGLDENQHYVAGLQYRAPDITASGEVSENLYTGNRTHMGGAADIAYDLNDRWQIGGRGEIFSNDTPLKALANGITANGGSVFTVYQPYDGQRFSLRTGLLEFSDNNTRTYASGNWDERLASWPHFKIDWVTGLWASHNTVTNAPYYNPGYDFEATTGPEFIDTIYRHYEFVYDQRLSIQPGIYEEKGHGSGLSGSITYQQRVRANDALNAGWGVTLGRQLYDGSGENSVTLFSDVDWRF